MRLGGEHVPVARRAVFREAVIKVETGMALERFAQAQALGARERVAPALAVGQRRGPRRVRRPAQEREAILLDRAERRAGAVPFKHREFGRMQGPALAVAEDVAERKDLALPRRQQLLHREFGRGVEIRVDAHPVDGAQRRGERMQMRLSAWRALQGGGVDLDEAEQVEMAADRRREARAGEQGRAAQGVEIGTPERRDGGHG